MVYILLFRSGAIEGKISTNLWDAFKSVLPSRRFHGSGATNNSLWVIYFFFTTIGYLLSVLVLRLSILNTNKQEGGIFSQLGVRIITGLACVFLTMALNHQRQHRHRDAAMGGDVGLVHMVVNIKRVNLATLALLFIYAASEFAASHKTWNETDHNAWIWVSMTLALLLNLPNLCVAAWICLHQSEMSMPSKAARALLMTGIVLRFFSFFDASLWNKGILQHWTEQDPCPIGGRMSFFDMLQVFGVLSHLLLFAFVVIEHRRMVGLYYAETTASLVLQYERFHSGVGAGVAGYGGASSGMDDRSSNDSDEGYRRALGNNLTA
jgi:hypothetical protein